ncbi:MAG: hypothetical protein K8R55_08805 [Desulfuromonadaceae bacterium]|nr:hypothetical protein [Desulfuromonadaceae bacterium]
MKKIFCLAKNTLTLRMVEKSRGTDSKHENPSYSEDLGAATQADTDYLCPRQLLCELNFLDISHFYFCLEQTLSQFVQYSHSQYLTRANIWTATNILTQRTIEHLFCVRIMTHLSTLN